MERIWESKDQRDSFFSDLREFINKHPNIGNYMLRKYQEDPADYAPPEDGYPHFDAESPMFLNSIVLIITHTNVHNWEDLMVLEPMEQSLYTTVGLVSSALAILNEDAD